MRPLDRRTFAAGLAAPTLLMAVPRALAATPRQSEGPYYPDAVPAERDADLRHFAGGTAQGRPIEMTGRVLDARGRPVDGARVEIWHCDAAGVYAHVGRDPDPHFQGYGVVRVGADGRYRFRTIKPGLYPGRTRHIHVKAHQPDGGTLTTQMYFPGEPGNADDWLLRGADDPGALIARADGARYAFDIRLA